MRGIACQRPLTAILDHLALSHSPISLGFQTFRGCYEKCADSYEDSRTVPSTQSDARTIRGVHQMTRSLAHRITDALLAWRRFIDRAVRCLKSGN
jgi:hypothetical protein